MKTILIVDDNKAISNLIIQFLSKDYKMVWESDGLEAIKWLQGGNIPDLIISDLQMPNIDGFEFLEQIKNSGYFSNIPVIIVSSLNTSNDRIKCLKLGAVDYLVKPFNPEELSIRISNILNRA